MEVSTRSAGRQIAHLSEIATAGTSSLSLMASTAGHVGEEMAHLSSNAAIAASATGIGILGAALGVLIGLAVEAKRALEEIPEGKLSEVGKEHIKGLRESADATKELAQLDARRVQLQGQLQKYGGALGGKDALKNQAATLQAIVDLDAKREATIKRREELEESAHARELAGIRARGEAQSTELGRYRGQLAAIRAEEAEAIRTHSLAPEDAKARASGQTRVATENFQDKQWQEHQERLRGVTEAYKTLEGEHQLTRQSGLQLLQTYQGINRELATSIDLSSKHGQAHQAQLLKLRAEMEQTDMMTRIMGAGQGGAAVTPNATQALAGRPEDAEKNAGLVLERARALHDANLQNTEEYQKTIKALNIIDGYLAKANEREGLTTERLRQQLNIRETLNENNARVYGPAAPTMRDPGIMGQAQLAQQMAAAAAGAKAAGAGNAPELERAANAQRERAVTLIRNMVQESKNWGDLSVEQQDMLNTMLSVMKALNMETDKSVQGWQGVASALHGVLDAAGAFGAIPRELNLAVSAGEHLAKSMAEVNKARDAAGKAGGGGWNLSNIAGAAGGALGAAGAVIGVVSSVASLLSAHDVALDKNTQKLDQLRLAMVDTKGLGGQQIALGAIEQWVSRGGGGGMSSGNGNQGLDSIIKASGLTLEQFNKIAGNLGIEFSKGTDWIIQFQQALMLAIQAATKFGTSLADQTQLAQLRQKVYGKDSPADAIKSTVDVLTQFAPKLAHAFDAIDVSTKEGQEKFRTALQQLFEQMASGTLSSSDYGTLGGAKDLATIIDTLAGSLTSLDKSASAAASALSNVPSGYKVALARFNAQDAQAPPAPLAPQTTGTGGGTSAVSQMQGTDAGGGAAGATWLTVNGDILVDARERSADELFSAVLSAAQRRAQVTLGRSDQWSRVQTAGV